MVSHAAGDDMSEVQSELHHQCIDEMNQWAKTWDAQLNGGLID